MTLLSHRIGSFLILLQRSGHRLIVDPLVTDELKAVVARILGQVGIGSVDETGGQVVRLLERVVRQGGVGRVLGQVVARLAAEHGVQVGGKGLHLGADIVKHGLGGLHVLQHVAERRNLAGHLVGSVHKGVELIGAGIHDQVGGHDAVLVLFVIQKQLLHVAGAVRSSLAGETGGLGDVAAGFRSVHRPVDHLGKHDTQQTYCQDRDQNVNRFLVFHNTKDL